VIVPKKVTTGEKRPRGRPPKSPEQLRRDHAQAQLANLEIWFMVESKRKGTPEMSVSQACDLIAEEASASRAKMVERAAELHKKNKKVVYINNKLQNNKTTKARLLERAVERLNKKQKYLFDADTLRRRHADAEALRQLDRFVAEYCARELARLGPWESSTARRQPQQS
jgi:Asp-tRNA(Asn)/Glu-tRNA(Gln) amidotransferase A subunit family amidase